MGTAAVALAGVGLAPDVFVVAACTALTYFGITYGNLIWGALMQAAVPAEMLGRASSVDWLFSICLTPLGIVFAGVLASASGKTWVPMSTSPREMALMAPRAAGWALSGWAGK